MTNESRQDARSLIESLVVQLPGATVVEAGSASYRWLLTHAAEPEGGEEPTVGGLPLEERGELPSDRIVLLDAAGSALASIEVTQTEGTDPA